ncbi:MAG: hypothetical protein H0T87_11165 [Gammaproteobacteria bacterium]|nr:hypothetical protein [Gammaproteobacteria bacterium]
MSGGGDARSLGGLAEVGEDTLNGTHVGHESDDPHRLATAEADEREDFITAGEQHRSPIG